MENLPQLALIYYEGSTGGHIRGGAGTRHGDLSKPHSIPRVQMLHGTGRASIVEQLLAQIYHEYKIAHGGNYLKSTNESHEQPYGGRGILSYVSGRQ